MPESGGAPLAHSGRDGQPPQTYAEHIRAVAASATEAAETVAPFITDREAQAKFVTMVSAAATIHDVGKLAPENQDILHRGSRDPLPVPHWDAGSAHLQQMQNIAAAMLVYAHHPGLPSLGRELEEKRELCFRVPEVAARTDRDLAVWVDEHRKYVPGDLPESASPADGSGLWRRMALSCLVDADHSDTARHFERTTLRCAPLLRPSDRLQRLDAYVAGLGQARNNPRSRIRSAVYQSCRAATADPAIRSCDSPVGTGKTTAVMAHLLQVAKAKGLRRIFVVLPFTNIINQAVGVYRQALVLPGENAEEAIAAHHHRAEFSEPELRHLAARWEAPIVVTTAVQFFETMAGNRPAEVRKLHQLAGSAIFIDEAHAALPAHLWPQAWRWLRELAGDWGCHLVLGSGSLARFWTLPEFSETPIEVPDLVPDEIRREAAEFEVGRIRYRSEPIRFTLERLVQHTLDQPGPRVLVLNTVQSAAVAAEAFRKLIGRERVEHLSTALCPRDREPVVRRVRERLRDRHSDDWVFVATSCVEAGLDFSFRTALRESCGLVNLIQLGGRANREAEFADTNVIDFRVDDPRLPRHPAFRVSAAVLTGLFDEGLVGPAAVTEAMRRELLRDPDERGIRISEAEARWDYPEVARRFRVIDSNTVTVVVDREMIEQIEKRREISWRELQAASVQMWATRMTRWPTRPLAGGDLFAWLGAYDDFIGYMAGVLPLADAQSYVL